MKTCQKCGEIMPLAEFYRHPRMADGCLNFCKACVKARVREHRAANLERLREYDRGRMDMPQRVALRKARQARVKEDPSLAAQDAERRKAWQLRHSQKRRAHIMTGNAIKYGLLKRQPCERCGEPKTDAHHEDYRYPLQVNWLCEPCHGRRHREINEERRQQEKKAA